ncbi:MAG: YceI family protein [Proteobacteria bacterium]|nr:YceI family protein [Pseudomonadota bacterium]
MLRLAFLILAMLPASALAMDVGATTTDLTFHISHPAKQYDAALLPGGASATGTFDPAEIANTRATVSIRVDKFNSDNVRRDSHMMETMEGLIFPTIDWTVKDFQGPTGPFKPGSYEAKASGPLTVHGVTLSLVAPVTMNVAEDGTVTVESNFSISLEEFGIDRPTLVFVPIEDQVPISVKMTFPAGADVLYVEPPPAPEPAPEPEATDEPAAEEPAAP